jgi:hypothetical protein
VFDPGLSDTIAVNVPPLTFAEIPFTVTVTVSVESAGVAVPATEIVLLDVLDPFAGEVMLTAGGVVFALTCTTLCDVFPAASVATNVSVFGPACSAAVPVKLLPVTVSGCPFTLTVTAVASTTVPLTAVLSAAIFVADVGVVTLSTGGVVSDVTWIVALPVFPAWSIATAVSVVTPCASGTSPA